MAGWIEWNGGDHPDIGPTTQVCVEYRSEQDREGVRIPFAPAVRFDWSHDGGPNDIVAFKLWEHEQ